MRRPLLVGILRWGGRALAVLGLLFVALRLREYWDEIDLSSLGWQAWAGLFLLSLLYGLAGVLLALAWQRLLAHFAAPAPRPWAVKVYGLSQISKYVPGNIFHLAARQGRGMAAGVAGWPLAKSAVWELGLLAGAGFLFGFLVLPLVAPDVPAALAVALFAAACGGALLGLARLIGGDVARAFAWQVMFLFASGLTFLGVLVALEVSGLGGIGVWLAVLGAYVLAWLAGLVTPGSPAGLGVRELALLLLLDGVVPEAELLQAIVLARAVSVLGDTAFFVGALALRGEARAGAARGAEEDSVSVP